MDSRFSFNCNRCICSNWKPFCFPFKQQLQQLQEKVQPNYSIPLAGILLDTEHICAVNTIVKRHSDGKLIGYNTDWEASITAIEDALRDRAKSLALAVSGEARQFEELTNFQPEKGAAI
ncbi:hypothetical protein L1987_09036 [Smallanthus sonchifolius]|uniref:Uncharacterized protein n=1 Tax=Smallanthus sonchifolius TaxID=185202 RepID=A0ACB9JLU0_9ASTR|nr:hypothetical protein L1987_09036 [Smallanthus sonchifolius]